MRKLAILTLPLLLTASAALAQQSMNPGFDNQTGHAQNAARMSGLHDPTNGVHQMNTNSANAYSAPAAPGTPGVPLTTATAPSTHGGALPLNGAAAPAAGSGAASSGPQ